MTDSFYSVITAAILLTITTMNPMAQITKVFHTNCSKATNEKKLSIFFDNDMIFWCLTTSDLVDTELDLVMEGIAFNS